jgi:hypothetical protein
MSSPHTQKTNSPLLSTEAVTGQPIVKEGKKQTVLESHGYVLGKTIGSGSYATVRVGIISANAVIVRIFY